MGTYDIVVILFVIVCVGLIIRSLPVLFDEPFNKPDTTVKDNVVVLAPRVLTYNRSEIYDQEAM